MNGLYFGRRSTDSRRRTSRKRVFITSCDFDDLAVHSYHDDSREKLILPFLREQIGTTGRLLDIGANWGHMCHFFENKGFTCTAIEINAQCCYFMNRLKVAGQKTFEVQCVDVFKLKHLHMFDAICALNIFHHFLKKSEYYIKFLKLLGRINCKAMVFQAHSENEDQMRKAFVDYSPRDFAEIVRIHAKFDHLRELGQVDGRMIFGLYNN